VGTDGLARPTERSEAGAPASVLPVGQISRTLLLPPRLRPTLDESALSKQIVK